MKHRINNSEEAISKWVEISSLNTSLPNAKQNLTKMYLKRQTVLSNLTTS